MGLEPAASIDTPQSAFTCEKQQADSIAGSLEFTLKPTKVADMESGIVCNETAEAEQFIDFDDDIYAPQSDDSNRLHKRAVPLK